MQNTIRANSNVIFIMKCLLGAYILTGGFLLLLALLLYRFQLKENIITIGIIVVYVIATFFSGFLTGKKMGNKKFLWGLMMGSLYFVVLVVISLLVNHSIKDVTTSFLSTLFICSGSGMLGGMLS